MANLLVPRSISNSENLPIPRLTCDRCSCHRSCRFAGTAAEESRDGEHSRDLDLLRIFRVTSEKQALAATRTDALLGKQFEELVTNRQMTKSPCLGSEVLRSLAAFQLGFRGSSWRSSRLLERSLRDMVSRRRLNRLAWSRPFFTLKIVELQSTDAVWAIAMATCPICSLLAEFGVFAS